MSNRDKFEQAYGAAHAEALAILGEIDSHLMDMPDPESVPLDWGYVGTLNNIFAMLKVARGEEE